MFTFPAYYLLRFIVIDHINAIGVYVSYIYSSFIFKQAVRWLRKFFIFRMKCIILEDIRMSLRKILTIAMEHEQLLLIVGNVFALKYGQKSSYIFV